MSNILEGYTDNVIVLRSVYGKVGQKYYIQPCKDPKTGRLPDCVKAVNANGDAILTDEERNSKAYFIKETETFIIEDGKTFNLNNEIDRKDWEAIKNCPLIAPERFAKDANGNLLIDGTMGWNSRNPRYGVAELYIDRPGYESAKKVSKKKKIHDACTYILDDPRGTDGYLITAKLLGRHMTNMPIADVEAFLLDVAEKDPERIIKLYTSDDLTLRILLMDARDKKVIIVKNGVYIYAGTDLILGANDEAVLTWMKSPKNRKQLELLQKDVYPENYELIDSDTIIEEPIKEEIVKESIKKSKK